MAAPPPGDLIMKRLLAPLLVTAALAASSHAAIYVAPIPLNRLNFAASYGNLGYYDENGDRQVATGLPLVHSRFEFTFTPTDGFDARQLVITFAVPTDGSTQFFGFTGDQFNDLGNGSFGYKLESDDYNGNVIATRFGLEVYALDANGDPVTARGSFGPNSGFFFDINVPEPTSLAAALPAALLLRRRRSTR
jgi:hypothetical protein